jgi:hypothetical protein
MLHSAFAASLPKVSAISRVGAAIVVRLKRVLVFFAILYAFVFLLWLALWLIGLDPTEVCHSVDQAGC